MKMLDVKSIEDRMAMQTDVIRVPGGIIIRSFGKAFDSKGGIQVEQTFVHCSPQVADSL